MRLSTFFIVAYITVALQAALGGHFVVAGAQPNLVLILAAFIALYAPRRAAILACFCLGAMHDMAATQRLGLFALSYTLLPGFAGGYFASRAARRGSAILCAVMTLFGGIICALVIVIHSRLPFAHETHLSLTTFLWAAVYSSLVSVIVSDVVFNRLRPVFGFDSTRRSRF